MAAVAQLRAPRLLRPPGAFLLAVLAGISALYVWPSQQTFVSTAGLRPSAGLSAARDLCGEESAVAMHYGKRPLFHGSAKFPRYEGFVYRRKKMKGLRMRFARWGGRHWPFYRIQVMHQDHKTPRTERFVERVGWWDPMKPAHSKDAFALKADRVVHWLRHGAQPTDQVATFLDLAGIIRRTGPISVKGEWEWRIDKNSGPEAPEGWEWTGKQSVTWGNRPKVQINRNHINPAKIKKLPLIERYGFRGYTRVPIEHETITQSVTKSGLLEAFPNTELSMYE
eukprot:TRINITY_DN58858_c0_g1_i1.p1 TRINITY_DN58858_c0_g1~~TRINITY_DN58858_c0_g1_i1.p1  ORF type:complete len:289 (-),score=29.63 TRINITY_DN58858_c0_g1_i1:56-898(-)